MQLPFVIVFVGVVAGAVVFVVDSVDDVDDVDDVDVFLVQPIETRLQLAWAAALAQRARRWACLKWLS